ncbi:MAG TPA: PIG-L family deacetylase [Planctomycetes bacterium]|nr:PIG-L family deacetylase [Planctomycetaceae bacterium]HIM31855.1 PIG-L family deacetylase [Planctomycetota bacterium]
MQKLDTATVRVLVLGAHPDDAEYHAGGLIARHVDAGNVVKLVSVTDGGAGHHRLDRQALVAKRRLEAAEAGRRIGVEAYVTWDFPDGRLQPSLELRETIIAEIRRFRPDLVLTHRTCDYHPDHRAVGQAVQDASYMVTVPLVVPDVPHLKHDPVVAYMCDLFTKPCRLQADVIIDIEPQIDRIVEMLSAHECQVFDFLPYNHGHADQVPETVEDRLSWLKRWYLEVIEPRRTHFSDRVQELFGGEGARYIEAYEVSEYAAGITPDSMSHLFVGFRASD